MSTHRIPLYRRAALLLPLWALLFGALAGVVWQDNSVNRGVTFRPSLPPLPWTDGPALGVNLYNIQFEPDPATVTRTLEHARDLGARYVRIQMPWDDVEIHAKGDFEDRRNPGRTRDAWEKYDAIFAEAARLGLEPIVRIDRSPDWARPQALAMPEWRAGFARNPNSTGPPDRYADYAEFLGRVAGRYRGTVRFFQVWNEPNLAYEWSWQTPDPVRFAELLRLSAAALRQANPEAVVLFPSLAPTDGLDSTAPLSDLAYLDRIYAAGAAPDFDILSAQAYGLGQPPDEHRYVRIRRLADWSWTQPVDTRIDVSRLPLLREVMERNGDAGTPVWISEFGYNSAPEGVPNRTLWGPPVSEDQKAAFLVGQMERARREWPWVGAMNVWMLRWGGEPPDPADPTPFFAIMERDFTPLPAYGALRDYIGQLQPAGVGAHTWRHPAVESRTEGWSVLFEGTGLSLSGTGRVTVALDGGAPAELDLAGPDTAVRVAAGLPDTTHTVLVSGSGVPAAFLVERDPPQPWLWTLAPALLIGALAAVGALIARAWAHR